VLARGLVKTLARLWPALRIDAVVHNGDAAIDAARQHLPDIIFMDIQMPGCSGLDAAERIVDDWPEHTALPLTVFVTAFDRFAVPAFEQAAVDYVLKPVEIDRLGITCQRLMDRLSERKLSDEAAALAPLKALRPAIKPEQAPMPLTMIQAGIGNTVHMVPVADVHYFESDDKYVRVVTQDRSLLIRTPLRELVPRLDSNQFMHIHRSTVVRSALIDQVVREDTGKIYLHLKGRSERLIVSRTYAHLFKPM